MRKWEIYWADVDFDDKYVWKRRPVLVVNSNCMFTLCFKMTSKERKGRREYKVIDWKEAGLSKPTWVRLGKKIKFDDTSHFDFIGNLTRRDADNIIKICKDDNISLNEELLDEKSAYHYGDLDVAKKAERRVEMSGDRGTGHFGTGFYAVSQLDPDGYQNRDVWEVDLDSYNLFKPKSEGEAYDLHDALKIINTDINFHVYDRDEMLDDFYQAEEESEESMENAESRKIRFTKLLKDNHVSQGYIDWIVEPIIDGLWGYAERRMREYLDDVESMQEKFQWAIQTLNKIFGKDVRDEARDAMFSRDQDDSESTVFMKSLGYDGIDVTDLKNLDNFKYGTVIYDLKPNTYRKVNESITESISNSRINNLYRECVDDLRRIGYQIDDDIRVDEMSTTSRLGDMTPVPDDFGMYRLRLSKYLYDETDDVIKDTILHELAHYLVGKKALQSGVFERDKFGEWKIWSHDRSRWLGHGTEWKKIINYANMRLGTNLERLGDSEIFRKASEEKVKYFVTCKHCGQVLPYTRMTKFVKDPNAINPITKNYIWACGNCHMSGQFEVKENKK